MMSLYEFKGALVAVRINSRSILALTAALETLPDDILESVYSGAVDYSKERVQNSPDPDAAIINAISRVDSECYYTRERIIQLEAESEWAVRLIRRLEEEDGFEISATMLRLYYLHAIGMTRISKMVNYSEETAWRKWREGIKRIYEIYQEDAKGGNT